MGQSWPHNGGKKGKGKGGKKGKGKGGKKGNWWEVEHDWQAWSHREPGNGYRPKANDPAGWGKGENKPTETEYDMIMGVYGPANKVVINQFKAYEQQETKKMKMEDRLSMLERMGQREKDAKDAAVAHEEELQRVLQEGCVLLGQALLALAL